MCRAEKEAKRDEKALMKQLERQKREEEKEKKRMERELQKEKMRNVIILQLFPPHPLYII